MRKRGRHYTESAELTDFIIGQTSAGNNWAKGHCTRGAKLIDFVFGADQQCRQQLGEREQTGAGNNWAKGGITQRVPNSLLCSWVCVLAAWWCAVSSCVVWCFGVVFGVVLGSFLGSVLGRNLGPKRARFWASILAEIELYFGRNRTLFWQK